MKIQYPAILKHVLLFLFLLIFGTTSNTIIAQVNTAEIWSDISETSILEKLNRQIIPSFYRTLELNVDRTREVLSNASTEFTETAKTAKVVLSFPMPNGTFSRFYVVNSPIMELELAAKYPEIQTYSGQGIDDPTATVRFDLTPAGFHAMILSEGGTVFIDPYSKGNISNYISYYKKDFVVDESRRKDFICHFEPDVDVAREISGLMATGINKYSGTQLRTYRLAVATTGEYTTYHGGTVAKGLAAVVTSVNRVNGVYEKEVAVRMVLVANNDQIIYLNASTDPYTNSSGSTMLGQNQTTLTNVIGSANYDIGHVFSTGGGGVAYLGCVCNSSNKAGGVTGSSAPIGDPFDIDYVAHEMGHQFGANHTFNGNAGSCAGGNRNASTAYEPGSGTTIMAYAGICSPQNIQMNSDDFFHLASIMEIVTFTTTGGGNGCPVTTTTGNNPPAVNAGARGFSIPISTPFMLTGSATDPNSDPLTYCWEEYDLGAAGAPNSPTGTAPIFRSYKGVTSPSRIFPKISNIVNNTQTMGEILPSYSRSMKFRLTARDNRSGGGGVGWDSISFSVTNTAGPFQVTAPNTAVSWQGSTSQTVTWNVANTNISPVNCSNVKILLSTDGGYTYPNILIASTPNDGTEDIILPNIITSQARIKVEAVDNVFFDISNTNFSITSGSAPLPPTLVSPANNSINQYTTLTLSWNASIGATSYRLQIATDTNFTNVIFNDSTITSTSKQVSSLTNLTKYFWRVNAKNTIGISEYSTIWSYTTIIATPSIPTLVSPVNSATNQSVSPLLVWRKVSTADTYRLQIASDTNFTSLIINESTISDTTRSLSIALSYNTKYFWRVNATNTGGTSTYSTIWSFTTNIAPPPPPALVSPLNSAIHQSVSPLFVWRVVSTAVTYGLQISSDTNFTSLIFNDSTITDTTELLNITLSNNTKYFWRVNATDTGATSSYSTIWSFKTIVDTPLTPVLVSPIDSATNQPISPLFIWRNDSTAETYRLQISSDTNFTSLVIDDSTITDTTESFSITLASDTKYFWRVLAKNFIGYGNWSDIFEFTVTKEIKRRYLVNKSWNLVSIPLSVNEHSKDSIFSNSVSNAFVYTTASGYSKPDTLINTLGYWLKYQSEEEVEITGLAIHNDTIDVVEGWNLIGSITDSVFTSNITTIPEGIIRSDFYGFSDRYYVTDMIRPAKGYWVRVNQSGKLILDSPTTKQE
jgi:hypothetical protein